MKKEKLHLLIIVNPISGGKRINNFEDFIGKKLNHDKFNSHIEYTKYAGHIKEIIENHKKVIDLLVVVGGDGTVNEAINVVAEKGITLAIIPKGSGNGLARTLSIKNKKKALQLINEFPKKTLKLDLLKVNNQYCINQIGLGFDAHIAAQVKNEEKRGLNMYMKKIMKAYLEGYQIKEVKIKVDGKIQVLNPFVFNASNNAQFGNGAYIAPLAELNDGFIELSYLEEFPFSRFPFLLHLLFAKKIHTSKYYHRFKTKKFTILNDGVLMANLDGEAQEMIGDIEVQILPSKLCLVGINR